MDGISRRAFIQNATVLAGSMASARLGRAQCSLLGCIAAPASGEAILKFNGTTGYVEVPSHPGMSPSTTGQFSLQVWIRPDTLTFPKSESTGYVMWAGKGDVSGNSGNQEYGFRMYNLVNAENRANRMSGYVFNPAGGLGVGSYVQEAVSAGEWIHFVFTVDGNNIVLYKNGQFRKCDQYWPPNGDPRCDSHTSNDGSLLIINPRYGTAPLRLGTKDGNSYWYGAMTRVAIWNRPLSREEVMEMYLYGRAISSQNGGGMLIPVTQGLVAAYPINDFDGGGSIVHDVVNGHNGTIHAGASWEQA